jgi:hypothetical protein
MLHILLLLRNTVAWFTIPLLTIFYLSELSYKAGNARTMSQLKGNKYCIFCVRVSEHVSFHIVICDLSGSIHFSTLCHKRHDFFFFEKGTEYKICVLIFSKPFVRKDFSFLDEFSQMLI